MGTSSHRKSGPRFLKRRKRQGAPGTAPLLGTARSYGGSPSWRRWVDRRASLADGGVVGGAAAGGNHVDRPAVAAPSVRRSVGRRLAGRGRGWRVGVVGGAETHSPLLGALGTLGAELAPSVRFRSPEGRRGLAVGSPCRLKAAQ